jgi:hypothetical protein
MSARPRKPGARGPATPIGEVRNAALTLAEAAHAKHAGKMLQAGRDLKPPRQK